MASVCRVSPRCAALVGRVGVDRPAEHPAPEPGEGPGVVRVDAQRHQLDRALLARLEAHRHARGDGQAHATCGGAVEVQRAVGLGEVVVRADLDRPVRGVAHHQREAAAARVEGVFALVDEEFAGRHHLPPRAISGRLSARVR